VPRGEQGPAPAATTERAAAAPSPRRARLFPPCCCGPAATGPRHCYRGDSAQCRGAPGRLLSAAARRTCMRAHVYACMCVCVCTCVGVHVRVRKVGERWERASSRRRCRGGRKAHEHQGAYWDASTQGLHPDRLPGVREEAAGAAQDINRRNTLRETGARCGGQVVREVGVGRGAETEATRGDRRKGKK